MTASRAQMVFDVLRAAGEAMAAEGVPAHVRTRVANRLVYGDPRGPGMYSRQTSGGLRPVPVDVHIHDKRELWALMVRAEMLLHLQRLAP